MDLLPSSTPRFRGIVRDDGRVGTRNYIAVLVTVNCAATAARRVAEAFDATRLARFANVDGVVACVHELGCGMEMGGEPMGLLRRTLAGIVRNPNVAGAVVLALGCERNNLSQFLERESLVPGPRLATIVLQEVGGTTNAIEAGIAAVERMLPLADAARRAPVGAAGLVVGMQVAHGDEPAPAHAALGYAADLVVRHGGTVIVSATSRLAGIAAPFVRRAASAEVAARLERRIAWWDAYSRGRDTPMQRGAHASGAMRATAEAARWGTSPLTDVCEYAHPVHAKGLVFMDTPAYEAVSATGQMAGGANVLCLATARGSGFGTVPAPTLKVATDAQALRRFSEDMDLDGVAGTSERVGERIFEALLATASGTRTRGEMLGVGEDEFVPWPIGITA